MSAENTVNVPPVETAPVESTSTGETNIGRKPRVGKILVLGSMTALGPFTIDMYLPALPDVSADLEVSASTVQLTITGTLIGLALGQLLMGPLSDTLGRKKPLLAGIGVHILASLLAVFAPSIAVLGILRVFQGMGAAAAAVVTMAIVRDLYSGNTVAVVMSRLMLVLGVAPILAPSIGGALLYALNWRGIFVVLALIGVGTAMIGAFGLAETLPKERRRPSGLTLVLRTYGSLLGDRTFMVLTLVSSVGMASLFAYLSGASFVYQDQYGLNQQEFAVLFTAGAIALIGASQVNVRLLAHWTPQQITTWALVAAVASGAVAIVVAVLELGGLAGFVTALWVMVGVIGFIFPNAPALALARHGEAAGTAAAMLGAFQFGVGAAIAPAVGLLGNTSTALAVTMTACVSLGLIALLATTRQRESVYPAAANHSL
ncbi:multidrug effflux MFS transporter [Rhodococcus erythropolis]|uniref:multidrug effflux MFS transporter n=1 Tax=Rhodococcus erythropolis TaxID=1833 RepID=UPI001BE8BE6D|nr:multidrug effflux MFS transporter [Rhodococcus erythropolis]MBT2268990.1 multidrug effflux MFS transporter [Rhodococcus erythropolis]